MKTVDQEDSEKPEYPTNTQNPEKGKKATM